MKKTLLLLSLFSIAAFTVKAQDTVKTTSPDAPLVIYGSVDTYFKYDFANKAQTFKQALHLIKTRFQLV
jgi:hypothetical protein